MPLRSTLRSMTSTGIADTPTADAPEEEEEEEAKEEERIVPVVASADWLTLAA